LKTNLYITFIVLAILGITGACRLPQQAIQPASGAVQLGLDSIHWHYSDLKEDAIPGISLHKAFHEKQKLHLKSQPVLVAILDSELDIYHPKLKDRIWTNEAEIPSNQIDDDHNGYIDDVHGWNFWGNADGQSSTYYTNFEYVRILKKFENSFENKTVEQIGNDSLMFFNQYQEAKRLFQKMFDLQKYYTDHIEKVENHFNSLKDTIYSVFPDLELNVESLSNIKSNDSLLNKKISDLVYYLNNDIENWAKKWKGINQRYFDYYLNPDYNDRKEIGDDVDDINDRNYGHNIVFFDGLSPEHATEVTSLITNIFYSTGNPNIQIMPIVVSVNGDEHDKDIALGIRYAVDNGAHIINMSFGKEQSIHNLWVENAIEYAQLHDVLIVKGAGNDALDLTQYTDYPRDVNNQGVEYVDNFMVVGASTSSFDKRLVADFSNYSQVNVDIFAPGDNLNVAIPNNQYKIDGGTSLSTALVTGIAALIKSYYPHLTASQIKEILMASGTVIDREVEITDANGQPKLVPFASLSKSGKIVNAYNALRLAQHYKKWKKGKRTLEEVLRN
jgi:cell wall-associated protease